MVNSNSVLRIFNRKTLIDFWQKHPHAEKPLRAWFAIAEKAQWRNTTEVSDAYGTADFLLGNRVIFNIKGNEYRLIVQIKYAPLYLVYIRFIGTHSEYNRIDATKI